MTQKYQLRPYQEAATDSAINWVNYMPDKNGIVWVATAGGKSILIAKLAEAFPDKRILILAHRKELLEQNAEKTTNEYSIYSAGLGEKDLSERIVFAGIQSIAKAKYLPEFDLVLIDEAHRVSNNDNDSSQYWELIKRLGSPQVIGFTATPYRLGGGFLSWGEIIYKILYPQLLELGFVTPLSNKVTGTPDLSNIQVKLGEYVESQLEAAMIEPELLTAAATAFYNYSTGRDSILIFAVSKKHCELLNHVILESGVMGGCAYVTDDTSNSERDKILRMFKDGELRVLINCQILTEGFDAPRVDMIMCLRPTMSKTLWEQMLGRGIRLFEGKQNCLIVDMAGNLQEHGSLAAPYHEKPKKELKESLGQICPECETFNEGTKILQCSECGYEFPQVEPEPRKVTHEYEVDTDSDAIYQPIKKYDVLSVYYRKHTKAGTDKQSLRVDYSCSGAPYGSVSEWLSVKHDNEWVRNKAWLFFKDRGVKLEGDIADYSFEELIEFASQLKKPINITVDVSGKYSRIIDYEFERTLQDEHKQYEELEDSIPFNYPLCI